MNGRSIQDIVPPARSKPIRPPPVQHTPPPPPPHEPHYPPQPMQKEPTNSFMFIWIAVGALVAVAIVILLMSTVFHSARVTVTILEWKSDAAGTYAAGALGGETPLTYTLVKVSDLGTRTVPATGTTDATDRAVGTIVVSNAYSAKAQRLITNTRFETSDGKVYRIHAPITVPGYTTRDGKKVAGTIEAQVYADQPGDSYNTDSATFKLPGLKGSNQYDLITATTKTPISGGFIGKRATVEKSVRDQAVAEIKAELERNLRDKVLASAPPSSIVFSDSISVRFLEKADAASDANATIAIEGTALAPAFPSEAIARELGVHASIQSDAPLSLVNPADIRYTEIEGAGLESGAPLSFTLSGMAHLRASFSELSFAEDLAGKSKSEAQTVALSFKGLSQNATITVRPFWLSTLPENPERITIEVKGALDQ